MKLPYRGRPNVQYSARKHPLPPNPFCRPSVTVAQPTPAAPPTSRQEQRLQETWG